MVTTAYLDEAERANRVGLMHKGRMIRCAPPNELRETLEEACYSVTSPDLHKTREVLEKQPGVLGVQPSGSDLHLFMSATASVEALQAVTPFEYHRIEPSLEDVFIALVRKEDVARAA